MPTELSIEEGADEAAQIRSKENTATDNIESTNQTTNTTTNTNTTTVTDQDHAAERNSMEIQNDEMTSSTTSSNGSSSINGFTKRTSITAPDPTAYVTKARITRPAPPAPSYNPMQFVQIKPCNLYQTAQEQLKKADEVKKLKEIKKEEPEEWQNNLDNWKSSRRKHVEHIIDRVVETKKLQLEEHDRMRRKSKTFSEMIEERAERSGSRSRVKLVSLAIYNEDEANDLSDLGIGTSSASGKSSLSEDYDNNSVMSDNATELEKPINDEKVEENKRTHSTNREYISSPGYDTSSSTAPASSPEPCEYTYEGAIQDYKQRVSRAAVSGSSLTKLTPSHASNDTAKKEHNSKDSTSEHGKTNGLNYRPRQSNTLEERLSGFSLTTTVIEQQTTEAVEKPKVDLPKIDISKRKEIFESQKSLTESKSNSALFSKSGVTSNGMPPRVTLRERFVVEIDDSATMPPAKIEVRRMSGDITSIRDRLQSLEQQKNALNGTKGLDVPVPPLKQRLSSLQNAVTKDEIRKPPVMLVDERQLEIMKNEEEIAKRRQTKHRDKNDAETKPIPKPISAAKDEDIKATTPAQQHNENNIAKTATVANTTPPAAAQLGVEQEQQLNAAIAALALEEQQLEAAASVVNQIEAEFAELTDLNPAPLACKSVAVASTTNEQSHDDMEFSVSPTNVSSISMIPSTVPGNGNSDVVVVVDNFASVLGSSSSSSLVRKPSIEMVHARNLLKMFKETFCNDNDNALNESKAELMSSIGFDIKERCRDNATDPLSTTNTKKSLTITQGSMQVETTTTAITAITASRIPLNPVIGRPPMSPKSARYNSKLPPLRSPLCSPTPARKQDSNQFSINGRVEIFNSKLAAEKSSPLLPTKKTHLPQLTISKCDEIILPANQATVATALLATNEPQTVDEALSMPRAAASPSPTTPILTITALPLTSIPIEAATTSAVAKEKRTTLGTSSSTIHSPQTTEVVVCASSNTQINPEELPKPNTVRALSSCFTKDKNVPIPPLKSTKTRSRIPTPTPSPPQSPALDSRRLGIDLVDDPSGRPKIGDPLAPNDTLKPNIVERSKMPELKLCTPNESTLFKLAGSAPPSPISPSPMHESLQGKETICTKLDVRGTSGNEDYVPSTSFQVVSVDDITRCDGAAALNPKRIQIAHSATLDADKTSADAALCTSLLDSLAPVEPPPPQIEELPCTKVDVRDLPPAKPLPATEYRNVSFENIKRCDTSSALSATQIPKRSSTPATPIVAARAAHLRALAETCEKIIAEERLASSQMRSSLPNSPRVTPRSTPLFGRKSKIPKPIPCCISAADSVGHADYALSTVRNDTAAAHAQNVETPSASKPTAPSAPPAITKSKSQKLSSGANAKKTKNIFDFLRRNFGHNNDNDCSAACTELKKSPPAKEKFVAIDNSKFYLTTGSEAEGGSAAMPPPLPTTPAPVKIEITKTITTDEIIDQRNSVLNFSQEINDMLDAELNKLNAERL